jgi:integrase
LIYAASLPPKTRGMDTQTTPQTAVTVNQILDRFEADYIPFELAARTQIDYGRHVVVLRKWYGTRTADDLKPRDFADFLNIRRGKFQRIRQLAVLSSAFTQAVQRYYWLDRNVLRDVKRDKGEPRTRLIRDEEFAACKALAPLRVKLAMDLALVTGQRQGDILAFRWADITELPAPLVDPVTKEVLATHELNVYQSKTKKRIGIAITRDLDSVLDRCYLLPRRGPYVLSKRDGDRYTSEGFRAMWQRTMRKWMRGGGENFHFHDIRALCATKCPTLEYAQLLLGHSNPAMTKRVYRRGVERVMPLQLNAPY